MKMSLGKKIALMVIIIALILSGTCILVSNYVFSNIMISEYEITADSMAATVAATTDGDRMKEITDKVKAIYDASELKLDNTRTDDPQFEEYSEQYIYLMDDEAYLDIRDQLRKIQDVSEVDCVYTLCPVPEDKTLIYIVDAAYDEDEIVTPGCFDYAEEDCYKYLEDLTKGFPAFITDTPEYGWMVTSCAPIYDSNGEVVSFAAVDISMNDVMASEHRFLILLALILFILTCIVSAVCILYVNNRISAPIIRLTETAKNYGQKKDDSNEHLFTAININSGDEIEILHKSMIQMENDIDNYIISLTQTEEQLTSVQQIAQRDSLTGIRNRTAYDKEIEKLEEEAKNGLTEYGIGMIDLNFLKFINDTFGHEQGNLAIIGLTKLVCKIFAHSPVFRIGGDEFAVILKNDDYKNIKALEKTFNDRINELAADDALLPWEKISAALGYALFDPEKDKSTDDVFKRADQNMYERKKAMKAQRTIY